MYSVSPKNDSVVGDTKMEHDGQVSDPLELLFFDTFSHESNEEINLDLVQFPKPVYIGEIRIIPLGARVQADFPGGVRLGATNPSQFKIEFFINDLSKPGASTFQHLGVVDYNQNGHIHFECSRDQLISTDGLVLRGWYTTITLAVYGILTKTTSPEPVRPDMSTVEWLQQHQQVEVVTNRVYGPTEAVSTHYGSYPVQEGAIIEQDPVYNRTIPVSRQPPYPWPQANTLQYEQRTPPEQYERQKEMYEQDNWERREDNQHWEQRKERHQDNYRYDRRRSDDRSPEYDEHVSADYVPTSRAAGGPDYYGKRTRNWGGNEWPATNQACEGVVTVPITTNQKRPHTPPIPTVHKECSPSQTAQFESMSPGDVESISEGDIPETEGLDDNVKSPPTPPCAEVENPQAPSPRQTFEPILSDDEITDDQFQDIEYDFSEFTEDPLKSFNPYTNEVPQLTHFADPSIPPCAWSCSKPFDVTIQDGQELLKIVDSIKNLKEEKEEWVEAASQATSILLKSLPRLSPPKRDDLMKRLNDWVAFGLNFEEAFTQPRPAMKLRHIKVGIKLVETISECGEEYTKQMILSSDAQIGLLSLFHQEYMALVIKLMILRALDATLRYKSSVELFIGKGRANGYESLWEMIQNTNHARIKFAISSLLRKLNLFDLLVKLNSYCDKLKIEMDSIKNDGGEITEKFKFDEEFLTLALEEVYRVFVNAPLLLSQPKRFLPVTSQFEINAADFPDPYPAMYTYFRFTGLLKNFLVLLNLSSHSVIMPINNLLAEFLEAEGGLKFLASSRETNDIISLMLGSSGKHNKSNRRVNPTLGLHMAYRLRALSYLDQLSYLSRGANDPDDAQSLEVLQGLFNLTLSNIGNFGKSSVVHAIALNDNIEILLNILKRKSNKKRSASRGYVCDLLYLSVKFSSDVPFLQKYSRELTELVSGDFVEMQEIQNWLVPFKNNCCDVSSACDILKNSVSSCTSLPSEMVCAVKLLKYLCIPKGSKDVCFTLEEGECVELKYKYNLLQTYSLDGLSSLVAILQKLTTRFEQPYLYSSRLTGRHGLMLIAFILPAVQLIRRILSLIIKARNTDFKDLSVVPVLLQTYALMQAIPVNAQAHSDSLRVCREIVDTLLAYTQPISSEDCTENEALNKSLWTLMIMEVLKFTCEIPLNFVTGLLVLSELLPLPLPLQSQTPLSETVKTTLANSRRLWSAHLHSLHSLLETMIVTMSTSNCHPLLQILRRVCVQLADLAAPTALMVVRTLVDSIIPLLDTAKIDSTLPRLLNFLARLVTHGSVKAAFLFLITSNDKYKGLISNMTDIFRSSADKVEKEQSQECLASIFLSVIDTEICLVPLSSSSTDIYLSHALPSKNLLVVICDSLLDHLLLDVPFTTCLTAMRTFILLVEHDFGFYHVKTTFEKRPSAIHDLFARIEKQWSKENHNLLATLSATLDFLRALACLEGVEYSLRKLRFSLPELLHLIQWGPGYPLQTIESKLKGMTEEDETMEPLLENVSSFLKILTDEVVQPCPPKDISEPSLPTSQPLLAQFDLRSICLVGQEISKERLTASYWLAPPNPEEQGAESDQVLVDLVEFAKNELNGLDLSEAISGLIHRKSDSNAERTTEEKKTKVTDETTNNSYVPSRGRNLRAPCAVGRGDAFRSRPPNTSRPPSLHVDDFVALETCGGPVTHGRPPVLVSNEKVGRARGRGRSFGIDRGSRYFGGHPATYHREPIETVWDRGMYGGADVMAAMDPISNGRFGRMGLPMGMGAWAGVESRPHPTDRGHLLPNFFQR